MKHITTRPEFVNLTEEDVNAALDEFEENSETQNPVVLEVQRLIGEYSAYLDQQCRESGEVLEDILLYEPETPIEQAAYDVFSEALHDSLLDAAEDEEDED